ncbi:MAG: UDP-3-O-(3-hydroxymyristoyl)glucosamine N-acyltransferase [Acidovorax sp.]|uniref:UDP-3-O-(3-hydroxymyristoyl)glucosamine N-acyltransferase n=1 Tax=Acidovorax sp. TaxID=1872122 RepID=UPI0039E33741
MSLLLGHIVDALGGSLEGEGASRDAVISRIAPLEVAGPGDLSFLSNPRYQQQLAASRAACVIVAPAMRAAALARGACIVADNPYAYFARATQLWRRHAAPAAQGGVHASAVVHPHAQVHPTATVGPLCVVERGARVGEGTVLKSRVTVGEDCRIGARCIVHAGVVIGADGFGFAPENGQWVKIEQLGAVRIGDDVEIGANTCIDRGALQDTVIEDGVKLDNLIQVGHNVRIGRHSAMAGCVGIAGSATIGAHCTVGGGAIVLGHLTLADNVHISAATVVTRSLTQPGQYTGMFPIDDNARWEKNAATLKQLHALRERIKALEQALKAA